MKEEKDVKGLSRRMLCKLMAGGAVAVGGNCLLPGSPLMAGRNPLIGVKSAEAGADLSQVSILARREIEARILMPVLNAFIKEYGKEKTVKLLDPIIQELAREGGSSSPRLLGEIRSPTLPRGSRYGPGRTPSGWMSKSRRRRNLLLTSPAAGMPKCTRN